MASSTKSNIKLIQYLIPLIFILFQSTTANRQYLRNRRRSSDNFCLSNPTANLNLVSAPCIPNSNSLQFIFGPNESIQFPAKTQCVHSSSTTTDGSTVSLSTCNGSNNQRWSYNSDETVRLRNTNFCLDFSGGVNDVSANLNLIIRTCSPQTTPSQRWFRSFTCPPGTQTNSTMDACDPCPSLFFKNTTSNFDRCSRCPDGTVPNESMSQCTVCPSGMCRWTYLSTVFAGTGTASSLNGQGTSTATFNGPHGLAVDVNGTVFVSELIGHRVRRITQAGVVTTVAGNGSAVSFDAVGTLASFNRPIELEVSVNGTLFVSENGGHRIRQVAIATGAVTTLVGSAGVGRSDGNVNSARLNSPMGIRLNSQGNSLVIADSGNHALRMVNLNTRWVSTLVGNGSLGYAHGPVQQSLLNNPTGIAIDNQNNVMIANNGNGALARLDAAFTQLVNYGPENLFAGVYDIVYDTRNDRFFVSNRQSNRVDMVLPNGFTTTIATANLNRPSGLGVDSSGNIYVASELNNRVIRIVACPPFSLLNSTSLTCQCIGGYEMQDPNLCVQCPLGSAKLTFSNPRSQRCSQCPLGFESNENRTVCVGCSNGWYRPSLANATCIRCPLNSQCNSTSFTCLPGFRLNSQSSECVQCPVGTQTALDGNSCITCANGTYRSSLNMTTCQNCPLYATCTASSMTCLPGFEMNAAGTGCIACPLGSVKNQTGNFACQRCPIGEEPNLNRTACTNCQPGSFKPTNSQHHSVCVPCPAGAQCTPSQMTCQPGFLPAFNRTFECSKCPDGFIKDLPGNFNCTECHAGTYASEDATQCLTCPSGHFQTANDLCERCGVGKQPSNDRQSCVDCPEGTYKPTDGYNTCLLCPNGAECTPTGFTCGPGLTLNGRKYGCVKCDFAFAKWDKGNHACTACPVGTESNGERTECRTCKEGYYRSTMTKPHCMQCPLLSNCTATGFECLDGLIKNAAGDLCVPPVDVMTETEPDDQMLTSSLNYESDNSSVDWARIYEYPVFFFISIPIVIAVTITIALMLRLLKWRRKEKHLFSDYSTAKRTAVINTTNLSDKSTYVGNGEPNRFSNITSDNDIYPDTGMDYAQDVETTTTTTQQPLVP